MSLRVSEVISYLYLFRKAVRVPSFLDGAIAVVASNPMRRRGEPVTAQEVVAVAIGLGCRAGTEEERLELIAETGARIQAMGPWEFNGETALDCVTKCVNAIIRDLRQREGASS